MYLGDDSKQNSTDFFSWVFLGSYNPLRCMLKFQQEHTDVLLLPVVYLSKVSVTHSQSWYENFKQKISEVSYVLLINYTTSE